MIIFKSIKPGVKFKSSTFREVVRETADAMGPKIKKDFDATTRTWTNKPVFKIEVKIGVAAGGTLAKKTTGSATGVSVTVETDSEIYRYVDEGTRVRYATMSPDFQPKTKPRLIKSFKGRGGLLFVNKKRPRPGIKAREFTKVIGKKWTPEFRRAMDAAMKRFAAESGHKVK